MDEYRVEILYADSGRWGAVECRTFATVEDALARTTYWQLYYVKPRTFRVSKRMLTPWEPI